MEKYTCLTLISESFLSLHKLLSRMACSPDNPEPFDCLASYYSAVSGYLQCLHDLEKISDSSYDSAKQELNDFHDSLLRDIFF